jgi:hypothetical protein
MAGQERGRRLEANLLVVQGPTSPRQRNDGGAAGPPPAAFAAPPALPKTITATTPSPSAYLASELVVEFGAAFAVCPGVHRSRRFDQECIVVGRAISGRAGRPWRGPRGRERRQVMGGTARSPPRPPIAPANPRPKTANEPFIRARGDPSMMSSPIRTIWCLRSLKAWHLNIHVPRLVPPLFSAKVPTPASSSEPRMPSQRPPIHAHPSKPFRTWEDVARRYGKGNGGLKTEQKTETTCTFEMLPALKKASWHGKPLLATRRRRRGVEP